MYEAKERQKFINNAQYLREMQHKMDSEYQACLRKQEPTRDQTEKKRDHHSRQELRQNSMSSISAVHTCERPWISRLPINRKASSDEASASELKSSVKSLGNKSEAKFPAIDKTAVKQKQKPSTCSRKSERNGSGPKKETAVFQKPILARRRMNQRSLLEHSDSENIRKVEGRGRKTPVLQGITKTARGFDSKDAVGQKISQAPKGKKKSQEKRNLIQSSKLSIDGKRLDKNLKKGSVLTHQNSTDSTVKVSNIPSVSSDSTNPNLPPIKRTPSRPREYDFCAMLCSHVEDSPGENEDTKDFVPLEEELLSVDFSKPLPLDQNGRVGGTSLTQSAQHNCEVDVGSDGRRADLPHKLLRQYNATRDGANEPSTAGQRKTRDQRKSYVLEENVLEDSHNSDGENTVFRVKSPQNESRPGSTTVDKAVNNSSCTEDWPGSDAFGRERQSFESNQRCYSGSSRPTVQRPLRSAFNAPASLVQPANRTEATGNGDVTAAASVQVTELSGSPRLTARRQLSPLRIRDSFSATESCQSSSSTMSTFEDSSVLEDSISNELSSVSPSTTSHDEDNFLNSHSSSSSTDSSHQSLFRANFTAHLHMTGPLPDQVPIFLTVSDLRNQSTFVSSTTSCNSLDAKEINKPEMDPEKLKKLQESLLAEDSEEEGDQCRICQIAGGSITNPLLEPCGCGGSLRFVHQECLKTWLKAKIKSGAELGAVKTCELCKQSLTVDLDDFNVNDYYRNHQQSRVQPILATLAKNCQGGSKEENSLWQSDKELFATAFHVNSLSFHQATMSMYTLQIQCHHLNLKPSNGLGLILFV
ncbi:hypothetical protein JRQ81_004722 [Phrynocephalus forsythii]|uniref:RING-type E3 ubiquitin transferase n=1 Tax=Phrynocephalus forsythii TaxID=171643 RepID=A0A9Q1AV34_9SAUR|nr:hypothetical protein JRQ81_004722 [Phrynocephalus forsythii]